MQIHPGKYYHPAQAIETTKKTVQGECASGSTAIAAPAKEGELILVFSAEYSSAASTEITLQSWDGTTATTIDMPTYAGTEGGAKWGNAEGQNPIARTKPGQALRIASSAGDIGFRYTIAYSRQGN